MTKLGRMTVEIANARVQIRAEDGRCMFAITPLDDGSSIEVRTVEDCRVGRVRYSGRLAVEPKVSNVVIVRSLPDSR